MSKKYMMYHSIGTVWAGDKYIRVIQLGNTIGYENGGAYYWDSHMDGNNTSNPEQEC